MQGGRKGGIIERKELREGGRDGKMIGSIGGRDDRKE